jgi:hypothetical protein
VRLSFWARQGPTDPVAVPTSLLLKVTWPKGSVLTKSQQVIAGQVEPGARIELSGRPVRVDSEGRFSTSVRLKDGRTQMILRARSVSGQATEEERDLRVDTRAPGFQIDDDLYK